MRIVLLVGIVAVAVSVGAFAGGMDLKGVRATSNGSSIIVYWTSGDETGVTGYLVERRTLNSNAWTPLVLPYRLAEGGNHDYSFEDNTAFRVTDNIYQYQIIQVFSDGRKGDPYRAVVTHKVSGIRRTWGSIKAMFR